jgi:serine/threonine protein kinase
MTRGRLPSDHRAPKPGTSVKDFYLERMLGEGTFGVVYLARKQEAPHQEVALKLLKSWAVPPHAKASLAKRFELEYHTGQISSPNLVQTLEKGEWEGTPFFTMEYCPNGDLRQFILSKTPFQKAEKVAIEMLRGLNTLHHHGKIHRDLKPENVLFDDAGRAKLTDFGIAGHLNIQLTVVNSETQAPEQIFGSYAYMAPEQASPKHRSQTLLPTIDIFNYGVICFELFSGGIYPFGNWNTTEDIAAYRMRAAKGDWSDLSTYCPDIPSQWINLIIRALQPDARQRFQHTDEMLAFLGQLSTGTPKTSCPNALIIRNGEEYGKRYPLAPGQASLIRRLGRAESHLLNELEVKETMTKTISRRQATLEYHHEQNQWFIRDGQWDASKTKWRLSKNGTFLNGVRVGNTGKQLQTGDIISVGQTTLEAIYSPVKQ